jgi:hypothetical protein
MIKKYHANNPKITIGIVTPKIYPFVSVVVFVEFVVFPFVELLVVVILPLHATHLEVDSLHV